MHPTKYHLPLQLTRLDNTRDKKRREYGTTFIRAGLVRQRDGQDSNWRILPSALEHATPLFNSLGVQVDHASIASWFYPQIKDTAGVTFNPTWNTSTNAIDGAIRLYSRPDLLWLQVLLDEILEDQENGREVPDIGLSAVLYEKHQIITIAEDKGIYEKQTISVQHVESEDIVFGPGAEGRLRESLAALSHIFTIPAIKSINPTEHTQSNGGITMKYCQYCGAQLIAGQPHECSTFAATATAPAPEPQAPPAELALLANLDSIAARMEAMQNQVTHLNNQLARQEQDTLVEGMGHAPRARIALGRDSLEQIQVAFESLIAGVLPPHGVLPLTGIRELYHHLSGDYEMTGVFQGDRVMLANVDSSTMAGMVANVLNKKLINIFQEYPRWWETAVTQEDFASLQDAQWITLGGVGELPTVPEGGAYTELTWDDQRESDSFVKKGGYLGITLEAIDKDDTRRFSAAPRALAQAAWMTLGKAIANIFTTGSGVGPTMSDSVALFHATHSNVGTTALSWSAWNTVRIAMQKQTELNSGERLGGLTAPYLMWVPIDLETTAEQILASYNEPDTAQNEINPYSQGNVDDHNARLSNARKRIVKVPFWTDTKSWAAQADPMLYPSIGLGYRYGRVPEIYSVSSPTAGLMFTNDTMPIKVRFFFAVGPTDWRGLYKMNVP